MVEMCYKTHTTLINPIIDWTTEEVWEFIHEYNIPYCSLYDEGFKRLGCIGCPMGSKEQREYEFKRWPKYKVLYLRAFEKMIENRGGYSEGISKSDSRGCDDRIPDGELPRSHRGGNRLYPYATTRVKQFEEMSPDEIMQWWID